MFLDKNIRFKLLIVLFLTIGPTLVRAEKHYDSHVGLETIDFNEGPGLSDLPIQRYEPQPAIKGGTDSRSLMLGVFFGLMVIMAVYNLFLYFSLRDRAYILYVGVTLFNVMTMLAVNGLSGQYFWPGRPELDGIIYITWAGLSYFCSSRFAAVFLKLDEYSKRLDKVMWVFAGLGLLMTVASLFMTIEQITPPARLLTLVSMPAYLIVGIIIFRKGFRPALFYLVAWVPYIVGIIIRTMHGAGWLPNNFFVMTSIEIGGALEIVLLSFALADRIRGMRKEIAEKELEKEQFKTKLLEEQKVVLEQKVEERTKELSEANATKDKFFSIIAHDLRSPMIALQGVGQKLEYFIRKDRQEKLLEMGTKIDQSIDQLNHLLNNLLNWATSEMGGIPHHPDSFDMKTLVDENIDLYKSLANSKDVQVVSEVQSMNTYADLNTTSTIIRNVLSNAIKFTKPGGKVLISNQEKDGQSQLIVQDEGPGMDKDTLDNLFTSDLKSTSGSRGEKGFGLGLKLCREFAEMNGGEITVESVQGEGSSFTISLPTKAAGIERSIDVAS